MRLGDVIVKKRIVTAQIDEEELYTIIAKAVAEKADFPTYEKTRVKIFINKVDRPNGAGFMNQAEVTLTNPLTSEE